MKRAFYTFHALALATAVGLTAGAAQAADPTAAQALFTDAKRLMNDGHYAEACPKLEESQRLDPGLGTEFNLASCYEHIGRTASAWGRYIDVAEQSKASGQAARERVAREHAQALESKIPKLVINVRAHDTTSLQVQRDGTDVGRGQWGTAVPIDPGEHRVAAAAPGKRVWERVIHIAPDAKTSTVDVPDLADAPQSPVPPPVVATETTPEPVAAPGTTSTTVATSAPSPPHDEAASPGQAQRTTAIVVGAVGLAGLGIGSAFGLMSKSNHDDADGHCDTANRCDPTGASLRHDAVTDGTVSTVAFVAGAAGLAAGAILWFTAPKRETVQSAHIHAAPTFGPQGNGVSILGVF